MSRRIPSSMSAMLTLIGVNYCMQIPQALTKLGDEIWGADFLHNLTCQPLPIIDSLEKSPLALSNAVQSLGSSPLVPLQDDGDRDASLTFPRSTKQD